MKTILSTLILGGSLVLGSLKSYSQEVRCDTIYNNNKEIDKIVFGGKNSFSITNFNNGKKLSEDYFGYDDNKLIFYRRTEIDGYGKTIVKEDFDGDGTINWMFIEDREKETTLIDENNDGVFDYVREVPKK